MGAVRPTVSGTAASMQTLGFNVSAGWSLIVMNNGSGVSSLALQSGLGTVNLAFQTSPAVDWKTLSGFQPGEVCGVWTYTASG